METSLPYPRSLPTACRVHRCPFHDRTCAPQTCALWAAPRSQDLPAVGRVWAQAGPQGPSAFLHHQQHEACPTTTWGPLLPPASSLCPSAVRTRLRWPGEDAASHRYRLLLFSQLTAAPPAPSCPSLGQSSQGDWLPISVSPAKAFRFSPDLLFTWSSAERLQMGRKARRQQTGTDKRAEEALRSTGV